VMALLLASRYPLITRVVAVDPLAWCFQGLTPRRVSLCTHGGRSLPFVRLAWGASLAYILSCIIHNKPFGFAAIYRKSLEAAKNREEARIKVENSNADLLLLGGQKDGWWDTHAACQEIVERLAKSHYPHSCEYVTYEDGGHACYPPFIVPVEELSAPVKVAPRLILSEGVSPKANAHMLEDGWGRAVRFFQKGDPA